jgi:hypothetical protein
MAMTTRILLSPGYHAQPGKSEVELHDVYRTTSVPKGMQRVWIGQLSKDGVNAWAKVCRELEKKP